MQQLAEQIKDRALRDNQLRKQKDDLMLKKLKQDGKKDLLD